MRKLKLVFCMFFLMITCAFFSISVSATTAETTTFDISTDVDWLNMVQAVNSMDDTSGVVININEDINLKSLSAYTTHTNITVTFSGEFNGNNHVISGLTVFDATLVDTVGYCLGVINVASGADIHNVILQDITYKSSINILYCGFVARSMSSDLNYIYNISCNIDCTFSYFGGVCGYFYGAKLNSFHPSYLFNFADITVENLTKATYIGGIFGNIQASSTYGYYTFLANYGDISCPTVDYAYISGICGRLVNSANRNYFSCCYNLGNLYGYVVNGLFYTSSSYVPYINNCYVVSDFAGLQNLSVSYSISSTLNNTYDVYLPEIVNSVFSLSSGSSASHNGTTLTNLHFPAVDLSYSGYLKTAEAVTALNKSTTNNPYMQDTDGFNDYYPTFTDTYLILHDTILPLVNGSKPFDNFGTLTGSGSGSYNSETGEFEYNITVNAPDYSGTLGNPNYNGSYTIPGESDDVGVDINDMSGFDVVTSLDFSSLFLALPAISYLLTQFISVGQFSLLITFVLLLSLIAWFFGRNV